MAACKGRSRKSGRLAPSPWNCRRQRKSAVVATTAPAQRDRSENCRRPDSAAFLPKPARLHRSIPAAHLARWTRQPGGRGR
eukprot:10979618-Alexandrium_andersonii.AAC.1